MDRLEVKQPKNQQKEEYFPSIETKTVFRFARKQNPNFFLRKNTIRTL